MPKRIYPSKLLLFGEYAVICGGEGLAIPYDHFSAKWIVHSEKESAYKNHLKKFLAYLQENDFSSQLDLIQFKNDLQNGVDLESNIPTGYGVGSSGALVAAVYDKYAINKIPGNDLHALKSFLGRMENCFHQKSSGLDPLVCYLNQSIHLKEKGGMEILSEVPALKNLHFELIDTGKNRLTNTFVQMFNERMKEEPYKKIILEEYLPLTSHCIQYYLMKDEANLIESLIKLSAFQFTWFDFAIPDEMKSSWEKQLYSPNATYKLCGAGGGGFMIRFSPPSF